MKNLKTVFAAFREMHRLEKRLIPTAVTVSLVTAVKLLCGLYYPTSGDILVNGKSSLDFSSDSYFNLFSAVFQDYYFMPMTIAENVCTTSDYDSERLYSAFEKAGILNKINTLPDKEKSYMIKDVYKDAVDFSGGEKQKLLLAKAIYKSAPVLILDEPTRGIDVAAKVEIYNIMNRLKKEGIAVIFVSSEMPEILGMSDRIIVMCDGRITGEMDIHEATQEKIMHYATQFENKLAQ